MRRGSGTNHVSMAFSQDTDNPISEEQPVIRDDIEVEGTGSKESLNTQEVEGECDEMLRTDPTLVGVNTRGLALMTKYLHSWTLTLNYRKLTGKL